jgi:hypothetical protein
MLQCTDVHWLLDGHMLQEWRGWLWLLCCQRLVDQHQYMRLCMYVA